MDYDQLPHLETFAQVQGAGLFRYGQAHCGNAFVNPCLAFL
jgi:hypothetical protein